MDCYIYFLFSALTDALSTKGYPTQQSSCEREPISSPPIDSTQLTFEEKLDLISSARSVESMLKWAHYFIKSDAGIVLYAQLVAQCYSMTIQLESVLMTLLCLILSVS